MYTARVRPILTYSSIMWWQAMRKKYNGTKLKRIQRTAYSGITGALQSSPANILNVLLHLLPMEHPTWDAVGCSPESGYFTTTAKSYSHSRQNSLGILDIPNRLRHMQVELQEEFCCGFSNQGRREYWQSIARLWHSIVHRQIKYGLWRAGVSSDTPQSLDHTERY